MEKEKTIVIFRKWKCKEGGIIALFPEIASDSDGISCSSYEHIGQHGGAGYNYCISATRPAKPKEYDELKAELKRIGYKLEIRKKASRLSRRKRQEDAYLKDSYVND